MAKRMIETVEFRCVTWFTPEDGINVSTAFDDSGDSAIMRFTILDLMRQHHCLDGMGRCERGVYMDVSEEQWRRLAAILEANSGGWNPVDAIIAANQVVAEIERTVDDVWGEWDRHLYDQHDIYVEREDFVCRRDEFNEWLRRNLQHVDLVELVAAAAAEG
ncbi:hypothetical protein HN766_20210 [Candidatus Poribacteria bacterium]|jgi:hypothetical protein|nr:hypothetical protein [Candidatus Poribacteria bacterium]